MTPPAFRRAANGVQDRPHPRPLLDLDLHEQPAARKGKCLLQAWNRLASDAQAAELGPGEIGKPAPDPGQPPQIGIVEDDGDAVAGRLRIQFNPVRAEGARAFEREQRVFRSPGGGAPVGDAQGGHRKLRIRIGGQRALVYSVAILWLGGIRRRD